MKPRKNIVYPIVVAILAGALLLSHLSTTVFAQPGTASDPLVTQRYVDELIADLQAQINSLQNQINTGGGSSQPVGGGITSAERTAIVNEILLTMGESQVIPFTPVFVPRGSTLIANAGVEIILRSGSANVIAGPNGLVDVTAGRDIANGQAVSRNHLILVPATDGRGLNFLSDSWIMIKGGFIIAN